MTPSHEPGERAQAPHPDPRESTSPPGDTPLDTMRRVVVIGSGGAGKSTFSRALAQETGLPLIHLDRHFWRSGWEPTPKEEWNRVVEGLIQGPEWIMDGNYGGSMEPRLAAADTVVFLDTPRRTCLARVVRRRLTYGGASRPSLPPGCPERLTFQFLEWVWSYPTKRRPGILNRLSELEADTAVHILRGDPDIEAFMAEAREARGPGPG